MNTMDCADIKALLSGLIDDQVDAETRHLAERHLAECAECRAMLDEAEAVERLIALDAEDGAGDLPAGFAEGVMAKIAEPETILITSYGRRLTTWTGWLAAAATLALAATLWVMERQRSATDLGAASNEVAIESNPTVDPAPAAGATQFRQAPLMRSVVFDPGADPALFTLPRSDNAFEASADVEAIVKEKSRELSELSNRAALSADDAQALYSASLVLEMIVQSDDGSFADVEMARQIVEYDELLPRLASVCKALPPGDRTSVMAAEGILNRVVHGPIDLNDLGLLRETVVNLKLVDEVAALSDRGPRGGSA